MRRDRSNDALRVVTLERGPVRFAEGSCLVSFGGTRVLCAASVEDGVPGWRRGSGEGWITAEYAMLPRATKTRSSRERQQVGGRTQEIQRLIGRSVRAMLDDFRFGEFTIKVDCDVIEADGGTRTASITGACVAVVDAFDWMVRTGRLPASPVQPILEAQSVFTPAAQLADRKLNRADAMFSSTTFSPYPRWMEMGDTPGHTIWHAAGRKLRSLDELPAEYLDRARRQFPGQLSAKPPA